MKTEVATTAETRSNGAGAKPGLHNTDARAEMLYQIKSAIDLDGRYGDRLKDMAFGYAAASGQTVPQARAEIERDFGQRFGKSPHEYLEAHFQEARTRTRVPPRLEPGMQR